MNKQNKPKKLPKPYKIPKIDEQILINLISPTRKMDLTLEMATEGLSENFVLLLTVKPRFYSRLQKAMLRYFITRVAKPGIYVTVNKSFESLESDLKANNLDAGQITFIDMITIMSGGTPLADTNCKYLKSASDLTELDDSLNVISGTPKGKKKFIILDSVSTLLVYNEPAEVEKMVHTVISKARKWNMKTVLLAVENEQQRGIIETISQFCDRIFSVG